MAKTSAKELFVLGRVSLRPTYGHEIMRTLRESRSDLWVELSEKHVYYILNKFERDGLVEATGNRTGNLPKRKVYAVTDAGRVVLAEMMSADSLIRARPYSEFDVLLGMLCYADALDERAKDAVLSRREESLESLLKELAGAASSTQSDDEVTGFPTLILGRVTSRIADELAWLRAVMAEVERVGWDSMKPVFHSNAEEASS